MKINLSQNDKLQFILMPKNDFLTRPAPESEDDLEVCWSLL